MSRSLDVLDMAKRGDLVQRPAKKSEYEIRFASSQAQKGWRDLVAVQRNAMADTFDFLTISPTQFDAKTNYPLKGALGQITDRSGATHVRWQHKPTAAGDARVWFYVDGSTVYLEQVHTRHPNETK